MSSNAPSPNRLPRVAPRIAQRALQRARLRVVPRPRPNRAPRVPFVVLVSAILLGGVLGLLFFNTSMQQASFRETALSRQARDLNAQQEALQLRLDKLRDPQRIARRAQRMGMVIPDGASGVLNLRTGRLSGDPVPAIGPGLPLGTPGHRMPSSFRLTGTTTTTTTNAKTSAKTGKTSAKTNDKTGKTSKKNKSAKGTEKSPKSGTAGTAKAGAHGASAGDR